MGAAMVLETPAVVAKGWGRWETAAMVEEAPAVAETVVVAQEAAVKVAVAEESQALAVVAAGAVPDLATKGEAVVARGAKVGGAVGELAVAAMVTGAAVRAVA